MRRDSMRLGVSFLLVLSMATPAFALPQGGAVRDGEGTIASNGSAMTVTQATDRLIVDWDAFGIQDDESVRFAQPGASAVALNRVIGRDPSAIEGRLSANGQVFLLNPNGVLFGSGARVDVGGLVASTLGLRDEDFLAGRYAFAGAHGGEGVVANRGVISAARGGRVALLGRQVVNDGSILAPEGEVVLGAGDAIRLELGAGGRLGAEIEAPALGAQVQNGGLIEADGGGVLLTAAATDALLDTVVNHDGIIRARTVSGRRGSIRLLGGMDHGGVRVAGTLDASAPAGGDGGYIETSGAAVSVADSAVVTTAATDGVDGAWLIDPTDFTIAASGGDITGATLSGALALGDVTIATTATGAACTGAACGGGDAGGNGDIFVNDSVAWNANTLTLLAYRNIEVNTALDGSGTAGLVFAVNQGDGGGETIINAPVNFASTGSFQTKDGSAGGLVDYTIITDLGTEGSSDDGTLQGLVGDLTGNYVLGADIDASTTSGWNLGAGFTPIGGNGDANSRFAGIFDGLGHTITGLFINRPSTSYIGLFGYADGATLQNVGLVGASVAGSGAVGALAGGTYATTLVNRAYATGSVSG